MNRRQKSKIVILGDSAYDYHHIKGRFIGGKFRQSHKATIGADFQDKEVIVDGKSVNLEIWDTAGQERFRCLGSSFYRGCDVCVLVYDITDYSTFLHIEEWIAEFIKNGSPKDPENFPFVLIGNKSDLEEQRLVDSQNVRKFMEEHPKILHFQTSAKNCEGVTEVFQKIAEVSVMNRKQELFIPIPFELRKPCGACLNRNKHKHNKTPCC